MIRALRYVEKPPTYPLELHSSNRPTLRNVTRVLNTSATTTPNGILSYKDHGLLVCEVHVLRQKAVQVLPSVVYHEFQEDVDDLMDIRTGVERQLRVVERIRWAYGKWLR